MRLGKFWILLYIQHHYLIINMFWRAIADKNNQEQRLGECTGGLAAQLAGGLAMMTSRFDITVPCFSFSFECFDCAAWS
jgi:hypothetical protein